MRIAVVTEGSTKTQNADVLAALEGFGHEVFNLGMKNVEGEPDLSYLETALISALALNLGAVDFVVGGCGTGQGYMNAALQFPGVACGLIYDPVEAWLFARVNAGNCVSLPLNKGYGKVDGGLKLRFVFEKLFGGGWAEGYPTARAEIQRGARERLAALSLKAHRPMIEIAETMDRAVLRKALGFPGVMDFIETAADSPLKARLLGLGA